MKKLLSIILLSLFTLQISYARTIEINVHGMTCPFCVDSLERKFNKMEDVSKVDVSLKLKKIRLETSENKPKIEALKQAVLDAGFTPIKVNIISKDENKGKKAK
jgi:copper chaperone CopZ